MIVLQIFFFLGRMQNHEKSASFFNFPNKNLHILFVVTFVGTGVPQKPIRTESGEWSVGSEGHAQGQCRREPGGFRSKGRSFAAEGFINLTRDVQNGRM